jgi:hypothetical protein
VSAALRAGTAVDYRSRDHRATPLWYAAVRGQSEAVKLLLAHGADPDAYHEFSQGTVYAAAVHECRRRPQSSGHQQVLTALRERMPQKGFTPESLGLAQSDKVSLRSNRLEELRGEDVKKALVAKGLFDSGWNEVGNGIVHSYVPAGAAGQEIVIDHATNLVWQKRCSELGRFLDGISEVSILNAQMFAGYRGWRLPTLEESMSLMDSRPSISAGRAGPIHIDPLFETRGYFEWTGDEQRSKSQAWVVNYGNGRCAAQEVSGLGHFRAVCPLPKA